MAADAEDNRTVVRRKVTFGEIEIRPYFVTAGDNPGKFRMKIHSVDLLTRMSIMFLSSILLLFLSSVYYKDALVGHP